MLKRANARLDSMEWPTRSGRHARRHGGRPGSQAPRAAVPPSSGRACTCTQLIEPKGDDIVQPVTVGSISQAGCVAQVRRDKKRK